MEARRRKLKDCLHDCSSKMFPTKKNKKEVFNRNKRKSLFVFCMLIIPILNFFVFWLYVNFNSIMLAFQLPDGTYTLSNFVWFFEEFGRVGSQISIAFKNTLIYFTVSIIVIIPLSIVISYFLYKKIRFFKFFRIAIFMPSIISAVALTTVYSKFIAPYGPFGSLLSMLGVKEVPEFLADSRYATWSIVIYCIWTGFASNMILFGGAMTQISVEVIESARLDGITAFQEVTKIIVPLVWPTLSTMLIFACVGLFNSSGPILLFTKGAYGTTTISYFIYDQVVNLGSFGFSAAAGIIFTLIAVPLVLLIKKGLEKVGGDY